MIRRTRISSLLWEAQSHIDWPRDNFSLDTAEEKIRAALEMLADEKKDPGGCVPT